MGISTVTFDSTQVGQPKEARLKPLQSQKTDCSNSSSVHPIRSLEEENLDYDSNASSSSFEFHKGERSTHNTFSRSLLRPMSSKWNDAEKWIINRQNIQNHNPKNAMQNRANRGGIVNGFRISSDSVSSVKRVDFCQPTLQTGTEKFSFTGIGGCKSIDPCLESKDLKEIDTMESSCEQSSNKDKTGMTT